MLSEETSLLACPVICRYDRRNHARIGYAYFSGSPANIAYWNHHLGKNFQPTLVALAAALASVALFAAGNTTTVNQ
jgi:hypothetical protein